MFVYNALHWLPDETYRTSLLYAAQWVEQMHRIDSSYSGSKTNDSVSLCDTPSSVSEHSEDSPVTRRAVVPASEEP